jgi:hypothetical protein
MSVQTNGYFKSPYYDKFKLLGVLVFWSPNAKMVNAIVLSLKEP